jgi:hypothetical protein
MGLFHITKFYIQQALRAYFALLNGIKISLLTLGANPACCFWRAPYIGKIILQKDGSHRFTPHPFFKH